MSIYRIFLSLCVLIGILAGCTGGDEATPSPEPQATTISGPGGRQEIDIPPAPEWQEATSALTLDNIASAQYLGRLDPPNNFSTVFSFAISPDSTTLVGLNNDSFILWDLITGEQRATLSRQEEIEVYYSSEGSEIYAVDTTGTVQVFDGQTGRFLANFRGHTDFNNTLFHYQEGDLLVLGGLQGEVKVWDTFERLSLITIQTDIGEVRDVALSPNGTMLAVAGFDGAVEVWDWENRERLAELANPTAILSQIVFSPDNTQLAVGLSDRVHIWSLADFSLRYELLAQQNGASNDVLQYSSNGRFLVNGGLIPDMMIWDLESGEQVALLPNVGGDRVSAVFSPDGAILLTSILDGAVAVWNMESITGETIASAGLNVETDRIIFVDWSDDGFLMLFFDALGPIYVWGIAG